MERGLGHPEPEKCYRRGGLEKPLIWGNEEEQELGGGELEDWDGLGKDWRSSPRWPGKGGMKGHLEKRAR